MHKITGRNKQRAATNVKQFMETPVKSAVPEFGTPEGEKWLEEMRQKSKKKDRIDQERIDRINRIVAEINSRGRK